MKFSIIMASRLVDYPSCGKDRDLKLIRAIDSVVKQTFLDWELHIIADGCKLTKELVSTNYIGETVFLHEVEFKKLWSGTPRNKGIEQAKGEWIIYLDNDDIWGDRHLQIVNDGLLTYDWVWFNDIRWRTKLNYWYENDCDIHTLGRHGTSNIAHKRSLGVLWDIEGKYAHDFHFVQKLLKFKNGGRINTPEYYVCHVPGNGIDGGYDL